MQNSNIDESEEDEYEMEMSMQQREPMLSPRVFTPQPMKLTPESIHRDHKRNMLDTSNDHDRKQLSESQSMEEITTN